VFFFFVCLWGSEWSGGLGIYRILGDERCEEGGREWEWGS